MLSNLFLVLIVSNVFIPQVKDRLLQCVTITSLRLAVKVNEEDEVCIPGSPHGAASEGQGCNTGAFCSEKVVSLGIVEILEKSLTPQDVCCLFFLLVRL